MGVISSKFDTRPVPDVGKGGSFDPSVWFRGDAALFGAVHWYPRDDLRIVMEYSSDAYTRQAGRMFSRKSPLNFGLDYKVTDRMTASARYLYGSEWGVQLFYVFNPYKRPRLGGGIENAPQPLNSWASQGNSTFDSVQARMAQEGVSLVSARRDGDTAVIYLENNVYRNDAQAIGRAARVAFQTLSPEIPRYRLILLRRGLPLSEVTVMRSDLEAQEFSGSSEVAEISPPSSARLFRRVITGQPWVSELNHSFALRCSIQTIRYVQQEVSGSKPN